MIWNKNLKQQRPRNSNTQEFHDLLDGWGLEQHVHQTYKDGHTPDQVFTLNVDVSDLNCVDLKNTFDKNLFDHFLITFKAIPHTKKRKSNEKGIYNK